jgi:hypothetical protein
MIFLLNKYPLLTTKEFDEMECIDLYITSPEPEPIYTFLKTPNTDWETLRTYLSIPPTMTMYPASQCESLDRIAPVTQSDTFSPVQVEVEARAPKSLMNSFGGLNWSETMMNPTPGLHVGQIMTLVPSKLSNYEKLRNSILKLAGFLSLAAVIFALLYNNSIKISSGATRAGSAVLQLIQVSVMKIKENYIAEALTGHLRRH